MTQKKSIAFFMHDFSGGGVERMRLALAGEFIRRGYDVTLIVVRATGPLLNDIPPFVRIFDLATKRVLWATWKLRRHIRAMRPDIVISSLDHNNIVAMLAFMFMGSASRLVICQHNALSSELRLGWRYRVVPALYRTLHVLADGIIAVSNGVADDMSAVAGICRDSITVVPNPVINITHCPASDCAMPHAWFGNPEIPVFVFVGRLVAQKDPMMLIDAFARRVKIGPARLIILGDGILRAEMSIAAERAGLAANTFFAGFVAEPLQWLVHAQALVLTSRYEGFGNVIVEALACGTPVVSTDCPHGPSEILAGGEFGILVAPGDAAGFARAMAADLRTIFAADALRARGREYTVSRAADLHEHLFATWRPHLRAQAFGLTFSSDPSAVIANRVAEEPPSGVNLVVTPNLDHIRLCRQTAFFKACSAAYVVCADGWPIALYAGLRHAAPWRRATGCDILHALLANSALAEKKVFVVVESPNTARVLEDWLRDRLIGPKWVIEVAVTDLANDRAEQLRLAQAMAAAMSEVVIMTIGAPVSEVFIDLHRDILPPCWALCVGQALRVELGLVPRAPKAWRLLGLEWAWRCMIEPERLPLRYLRDLCWLPRAIVNDIRAVRGF